MSRFLRLLRYGLPYTLEWLPGVVLSALVGMLDTFRVLLLQPIFDQVLRPDAPEGPILLGLTNSRWHFDLRTIIPHFLHIHNAWNVVAIALVLSTLLKGLCDYSGHLSGQLCRLRHHYRSAQSSLRSHDAPLLELLPQAPHRHHSFHAHQRCGPRANCAQFGDRRFPAAVLHLRCRHRPGH